MMRYILVLVLLLPVALLQAQSTATLRLQAEAGDIEAAIQLSERYSLGSWSSPILPDSARYYLTLASSHGSADAAYLLGLTYLHGLGIPRQPKVALGWLELAAERGNRAALTALIRAYSSGTSMFEDQQLQVQPSPVKALHFASLAARRRDPEAILYMAQAHHRGTGTPPSDSLALCYLRLAADTLAVPEAQLLMAEWWYKGLTTYGTDLRTAHLYYKLAADNPKSDVDQTTLGKVGQHECIQWLRNSVNLHWALLLPDPLMSPQLYVRP